MSRKNIHDTTNTKHNYINTVLSTVSVLQYHTNKNKILIHQVLKNGGLQIKT